MMSQSTLVSLACKGAGSLFGFFGFFGFFGREWRYGVRDERGVYRKQL
jgi:hypothetical protein